VHTSYNLIIYISQYFSKKLIRTRSSNIEGRRWDSDRNWLSWPDWSMFAWYLADKGWRYWACRLHGLKWSTMGCVTRSLFSPFSFFFSP